MQTLRKKTSPLKYKNETTRFLGDGVSFKAKLIGILEVSEARGDRMCQEALSDLKMAIRAAGEHKQRITIHIALDGLRLRDEKTGDSLYHHPVHKISFIAQDMTDSRAFGYIFGSPDTGHRFFGIKTDKAASQVVIAMRDLFQVVFALKKKEIELAKIHLEKTRFPTSPIFSENPGGSSKLQSTTQDKSTSESKASASAPEAKSSGTAVADLVDLELELSSLQQGLNQMERITPSDPFGSKDDPFGDSFISYPKPILPPPPSSGRERSSRTSETSSLFSPKTPHTAASLDTSAAELNLICGKKDFSFSHDFSSSREEPSSGDWFTPSAGNSLFEEPPLVPPEPSKDEKHELAKQEILSQFDVFTELDPLELKNPPKKVLNDLVSNNQNQAQDQNLFPANFNQISQQQTKNSASYTNSSSVFTNDPFGEDPFVKEDPFAEADFSKQDPFETEYNDKFFPKDQNNLDKFKFDSKKTENLQTLLQNSNLSRSPKSSLLEKQSSVPSTSPRTVQFSQHNTFDAQFDKLDDKKMKLTQLHENPSLDMSSESECAPEPPPRPASTLMQIKPPPLPPKKQNDLAIKPPPRPPHTEDPHYDYMDNYETAPNSIEYVKNIEKSPPLPVPARKSKFESDFTIVPERPKKHFNLQSSEEDYLTPITFSDSGKNGSKEVSGNIYLPPPQKSTKKLQQQQQNMAQVTVASYLESKPNLTTSVATDKLNSTLEGLDITLSQLTLSGLNELATKLNIPSSQLSNMTLVQLTNYLSNFVKSSTTATESNTQGENSFNSSDFPAFQADFAANFNNLNNAAGEMYDRYAVFRELMQEEIKQTKIDTEPEQLQEEKQEVDNSVNSNLNTNPLNDQNNSMIDKYAALREIVEIELKQSDTEKSNENESTENIVEEQNTFDSENNENIDDINIANKENKFNVEDKERDIISSPQNPLIEYTNSLDNKDTKVTSPLKSPKSPIKQNIVKSPIPSAISEIIQTNTRLTSGSLSDVISGSSPEIDNTANSDSGKKTSDAAGESWAIFDQANLRIEAVKETEKQAVQSEEGVSPWSSDSKEFGNGSPPDWRGDAPEEKWSKRRRDQEGGWWDTAAEPETQYYPSNRRSTDSYEDEYYECYDRPRRRRQGNWSSGQAAGGHSSSSRDVSPWEEEPRRREARESRPGWGRHQRQQSFERHKDRVHTDSWDEEDDYEYDDEHGGRFHWSERHSSRESDRHSAGSREHEDRWTEERNEDRRHRRRRDRWCCPDWDQTEHEKSLRYSGRWTGAEGPPVKWRDRKHDPRYYSRDSQESPWEDEYANEPEETHSNYYLQAKRNWKQRPSSASEMDRKTGEIKSRHYIGGSDGERDRRYKSVGRRSRSRDSQYSEPPHKHKSELGPPIRNPHRTKPHPKSQPQVDTEFIEGPSKKIDNSKLELSNKKSSTLAIRKKSKESLKTEETAVSTFPRKSTSRAKSLFENDFMTTEASATSARIHSKLNFDNEFETSEAESPTLVRPLKGIRQHSLFEKEQDLKENRPRIGIKESKLSPRYQSKAKSLFEDDFSPSEKSAAEVQLPEDNSISSIKEENDPNEEEDSFSTSNFENATNSRKKILSKNRLSNSMRTDINLKKSESVNIFARESDPFDDDFFCGNVLGNGEKSTLRNTELRWTDDFDDFDTEDKK